MSNSTPLVPILRVIDRADWGENRGYQMNVTSCRNREKIEQES